MSRIGKMPIPIPDKVTAVVQTNQVEISGPLGKVVQALPPHTAVKVNGAQAVVELIGPPAKERGAFHGLARSLVRNAIWGVTQGFKKDLEIIGIGYRAQIAGDKLILQLGFAHPVEFRLPAGIKVSVDSKQTAVSITGADRHLVGEVAAQIRRLRPPEPYKGTGIRYVGERIVKKAGKAAVGAVGATAGGGAKK